MAQSPMSFFKAEDLPQGILLQDPSHLCQEEVFTLWELWTSLQKDGLVGLISQDVTHGIKEKTWARSLPARPRERGQTWLGMITHCHHPLMVRMKSTWGMQLVLVWGHYPRARASQLTRKMTTTQVGRIWVTLTLIKAHKESMLQTRLALQSSSMIYRPLPILGTPKKKGFSSLGCSRRKLHTRPW